jgi:hypothetical protein
MRLQVKGARARRASDEIEDLRARCIAHVDGRDPVAEPVAYIGVAAMHHDLDAVAAAAEVAMADELDIAGCNGIHVTLSLAPTALRPLRWFQAAAEKQLSNARIGENVLRSILDARTAEFEYNSKI